MPRQSHAQKTPARRRPVAYRGAPKPSHPGRTVMLSTVRGDSLIDDGEAAALALDLLAVLKPTALARLATARKLAPATCVWCGAADTRRPDGLLCSGCYAVLAALPEAAS